MYCINMYLQFHDHFTIIVLAMSLFEDNLFLTKNVLEKKNILKGEIKEKFLL